MDNKYMKRCSKSLVIREMKIKSIIRYHFSHTLGGYNKKKIVTTVDEDVEESEPLYTASGNVKWCRYLSKQSGSFLKS